MEQTLNKVQAVRYERANTIQSLSAAAGEVHGSQLSSSANAVSDQGFSRYNFGYLGAREHARELGITIT